MIRANDSVTFVRKQNFNYMYKCIYIQQNIYTNNMLYPLEFVFKRNYSSNGSMFRNIIEIKYMQKSR